MAARRLAFVRIEKFLLEIFVHVLHENAYAHFRITKLAYIALLSLLLLQINEAKKSQKRFDYVHSQPERDTFLLILNFFSLFFRVINTLEPLFHVYDC